MMRTTTRLLATVVAVLALLAPAAVAQAAPPYELSIDASEPTVFPAVDGHVDTTVISGAVTTSGSEERIRGSVMVRVGKRVVATWQLTRTGPFSFTWNGRSGSEIVAGAATVSLRVDGHTPVSDTFTISAKKITAVTWTKKVTAYSSFEGCEDDNFPFLSFFACQTGNVWFGGFTTGMRIDARGGYDSNIYALHQLTLPAAIRDSFHEPRVTVTAKFNQSGKYTNSLMVCTDEYCSDWTEKAFKKSSTVSATVTQWLGEPRATWWVNVAEDNVVSYGGFTVKIVYYALR